MMKVLTIMENDIGTTVRSIAVPSCKKMGLYFVRSNHTGGNTVFSVQISCQPPATVAPTFVTCNLLVDNVVNTNAEELTRVASKTLNANGGAYVFLDPAVMCSFLQVTATVTTDGKSSAYLIYEE